MEPISKLESAKKDLQSKIERIKAIQADIKANGATPQHEDEVKKIAVSLTAGFKGFDIMNLFKIVIICFLFWGCAKSTVQPQPMSTSDSVRVQITTKDSLNYLIAISNGSQYYNYSYHTKGNQTIKYLITGISYFQFAITNYTDTATMQCYVNGILKGTTTNFYSF